MEPKIRPGKVAKGKWHISTCPLHFGQAAPRVADYTADAEYFALQSLLYNREFIVGRCEQVNLRLAAGAAEVHTTEEK
jgi:hypothetical protein